METENDDDEGISQSNADRGNQSIIIDTGKHIATVAICAVICGMSVVFSIVAGLVAWDAQTNYQITLNHVKDLESAQKLQDKRLEDLINEQRRR